MRVLPALLFALFLLLPAPVLADSQADQAQGLLRLLPKDSITERTITVRGQKLTYVATAGTLDLFGQDGNRNAKIFYTAYTLKDAAADKRPLTFAFNGGPGAASVYLHLGVAGPKIASFTNRDGANAQLTDNPDTWLPFTDLVFVDPVGTGWSRTAKADDAKNYYGVRPDAQMLAKVISLYVANNNRLPSPKYILGESYGGFRAVKIARTLQNDQGIVLSGIVALSPLLDGALQFGANRYALGAAIQFPSLAAAELERRNAFTPEALAAAERFALTEYLTTLAGPAPQGEAATRFYGKVAQMTGLPVDIVARNRGFIRDAYVKHLREKSKEVVSPYDVAISMPDPFPESGDPASRRSGAERLHPRARRAVRRLCPQRARLRDADDLRAAIGRQPELGLARRKPGQSQRHQRYPRNARAQSGLQAAGRARQRRSRDALRRQQICDRPPAAAWHAEPRAAQGLSRRAHVLFRPGLAQSIHRRGAHVLQRRS